MLALYLYRQQLAKKRAAGEQAAFARAEQAEVGKAGIPLKAEEPQVTCQESEARKASGGKVQDRVAEHAALALLGPFYNWWSLVWMLHPPTRHRKAFKVAVSWGISVVLVGVTFTSLCAAGVLPTTVQNMKAEGLYAAYQTKYALYIFSGFCTTAGTILLYKALKRGPGPQPSLLALRKRPSLLWTDPWVAGHAIIALANIVAWATIGITAWILARYPGLSSFLKEVGFSAGIQWWQYFLQCLAIFQRTCLFLATDAALWAAWEAQSGAEGIWGDRESEAVRQSLVEAGW